MIRALCLFLFASASASDLFFSETFEKGDPFESGKWIKSQNAKYVGQPLMVKRAQTPIVGFEDDKGLVLTQEMKHYGVSSKFTEPLKPDPDQAIVLQYEVKLEEGLNCGGAYLKLPRAAAAASSSSSPSEESADLALAQLSNETPYSIMFGPDKCGSNNKVHFILQFQSPITGEWEEKHLNVTVPIKNDKRVHLYTLVIRPDNTFDILVDMSSAVSGSLLTHLLPPVNPPATIDDITDSKPTEWVDEATIDDPAASKPEEWDESQPRKIPDPDAVKPAAWQDNAPLQIPDPSATKPEDWDDEEDGEWEAPLIPNPLCDAVGCGVWTRPTINNPLYRGKWIAPKVPNPAYIGVWAPRQIPNPNYFHIDNPFAQIAPMIGVAIEVWTTNAAILFDNIVVARSLAEATAFAEQYTKPKTDAEQAQAKAADKATQAQHRREAAERGGFKGYVEARVMDLVDYLNENPAALWASVAAVVIPFLWAVAFGGKDAKVDAPEEQSPESEAVVDKKGE